MVKRVCARPGCPAIIDAAAYKGLCAQHRAERDRQRGTAAQRGYDAEFRRIRVMWVERISTGEVVLCWRCNQPVGMNFHLGHDDSRNIVGPEHPSCNLTAAGKASHGL